MKRDLTQHHYRLSLEPLAPIHIGSGQSVEPHEYMLTHSAGHPFLLGLDLPQLLEQFSDEQRHAFDRLLSRNDMPTLARWIHEQAHPQRHRRFAIQVQENVHDDLQADLIDPRREGQIHLFVRGELDATPFLPGSSLKGAIRTALLDTLFHEQPTREQNELVHEVDRALQDRRQQKRIAQRVEARLLGHLDTQRDRPDLYRDPLRQVALADMPMPHDATVIDRVYLLDRDGRANRQQGIRIYRELTWSHLEDEPLRLTGQARFAPHLAEPQTMGRDRAHQPRSLPRALDPAALCHACQQFYQPRLEDELQRFLPPRSDVAQTLRQAAQRIEPNQNQCLVRLGRHSHFECITLSEPLRQPPRRGAGRSRTFADARLPLGWARLSFHPETPGRTHA